MTDEMTDEHRKFYEMADEIDKAEEAEAEEVQIKIGTKDEVEAIMESLVMDVCEFYGRQYTEKDKGKDKGQPSMRATAQHFKLPLLKIKKILVTGGLFQTQLSDEIQMMYVSGLSMKEIARRKNMSIPNVSSYLPYARVIYNLDVRKEEAAKALMWRQKQANRIIGRPPVVLQKLFERALKEFHAVYPQSVNIQLFSCVPDSGLEVLTHLARSKGFNIHIPAGMTAEEFIDTFNGVSLMYGTGEKGEDIDAVLIRSDLPDLKETMLHLIAQIYCRRHEIDGGFFYRNYCEDEQDILEQKVMKTGYAIWSGYITEKMVDKVLGRETWPEEDVSNEITDAIVNGSTSSMSWLLLNAADKADKADKSDDRETQFSIFFPETNRCVAAHKDDYHICKGLIRRLGSLFLIESGEALTGKLRRCEYLISRGSNGSNGQTDSNRSIGHEKCGKNMA